MRVLRSYTAAIEFKGAGLSSRVTNTLTGMGFFSVADLRRVPWDDARHVRGLNRRLLAARGLGPVEVSKIKRVYEFGHVNGTAARTQSPDEHACAR